MVTEPEAYLKKETFGLYKIPFKLFFSLLRVQCGGMAILQRTWAFKKNTVHDNFVLQ